MTLGRLMELYQAELQGKQIMMKTRHWGEFSSYEYTSEVKITECELNDLISDATEDESYTYFIKDEEDEYGCKTKMVVAM